MGCYAKQCVISSCASVDLSHLNNIKPVVIRYLRSEEIKYMSTKVWCDCILYHPRQQHFMLMTGVHSESPIRGELGYAHWPQLVQKGNF